mmetsp:Transcript_50506/g.109639  ORF Transcript_50506/g.109639 Transcript_50506/m.109639 type:complete len:298 (+) Transcript_50506:270-1163(+)
MPCLGREVIVSEDHLVIIAVGIREEGFAFQVTDGLRNAWLLHLQRELVRVPIRLDCAPGVDFVAAVFELAPEEVEHLSNPLDGVNIILEVIGHVSYDAELVVTSREDHFTNGPGSTLSLLLGGVRLLVHGFHASVHELHVASGLIDGGAEELQATHVCRSLDLDATLATLLDDLLHLCLSVGSELLGGLLRWCLRCCCLILLPLLGSFLLLCLLLCRGLLLGSSLLLGSCLLLRCGLLLRCSLLLRCGLSLGSSSTQGHLTQHRDKLGLRQAEVEPSHQVSIGLSEGFIEYKLHTVD